MKQTILISLILLFPLFCLSQTTISGCVKDNKGNTIPFANIFLLDTYDGVSSDANGNFSFTTSEKGKLTLGASCIGYKSFKQQVVLNNQPINTQIILEEEINELDMVVITAGAFEASDEKKAVILKPIDIVTTAGSQGDIYGAIQRLPGVQVVGEREGLFVRGGDAAETKTIIDEMIVQNPYYSPVPDVPQRGRFYPFLFDGTIFSSGGYSAQYGQALSSTLVLKSLDIADTTNTSFGLNLVGGNVSHTQKWNSGSISIGGSYTNVKPYFALNKTNTEWKGEPVAGSGEIIFRQKFRKSGLFKLFTNIDGSNESLYYPGNEYVGQKKLFTQKNQNLYINSSYRDILSEKWSIYYGISYSKDKDDITNDTLNIISDEVLAQTKIILTHHLSNNNNIKFGGETHKIYVDGIYGNYSGEIDELYKAGFLESNNFITKKLATRIGLRYEHSGLISKSNIAPRFSLAYKTSKKSQVSFAYGLFYQTPENEFLYQTHELDYENASHYIANYQWMSEDRTFRIELYDKEYNNLVKYNSNSSNWLNNSGYGHARGIDIFWRDKESIPKTDYWISYSYIDTKRNYKDFPKLATPDFVSNHTLSLVYKYWISNISTSVSMTYLYASGRPYFNPNTGVEFHSERIPDYHNLSFSTSKLTSIMGHFAVLFASVDNILNTENIYGYRFIDTGNGDYTKIKRKPSSLRTFFIGCFITIE